MTAAVLGPRPPSLALSMGNGNHWLQPCDVATLQAGGTLDPRHRVSHARHPRTTGSRLVSGPWQRPWGTIGGFFGLFSCQTLLEESWGLARVLAGCPCFHIQGFGGSHHRVLVALVTSRLLGTPLSCFIFTRDAVVLLYGFVFPFTSRSRGFFPLLFSITGRKHVHGKRLCMAVESTYWLLNGEQDG